MNDQTKKKDEQINKLKEQLEERNNAESFCLKDLLTIVKNFTDSNDKSTFLDGVDSISRR